MTKLTLGTSLSPETQAKLDALTKQSQPQVKAKKQIEPSQKNNPGQALKKAQNQTSKQQKDKPQPNKVSQADNKRQQRYASRQAFQKALTYLYDTYPDVFKHENIKALKIGLDKDLFLHLPSTVSKVKLRQALSFYTRRIGYLQALAEGGPRIDLQEHEAGIISDEQQAYAQQALTEALEQQKERREKQQLRKEKQAEYRRRKEQPLIASDDIK